MENLTLKNKNMTKKTSKKKSTVINLKKEDNSSRYKSAVLKNNRQINHNQVFFVAPKRSFWTGVSSILSIFGEEKKFYTCKSGQKADCKALYSDWAMIGEDLSKTMSKIILQDCE